jgi:hypothetical protein
MAVVSKSVSKVSLSGSALKCVPGCAERGCRLPRYVQDGQVPADRYPSREYFPRNVRPPEWVEPFVAEVRAAELRISMVEQGTGLHSERAMLTSA